MNTQPTFSFRTFVRSAAKIGLAALAFVSLAATAQADVVVEQFVDPQHTYGVTPGTTAMQLKVWNNNNYSISGASIQTYIYLPVDVYFHTWTVRAMPKSANFSLAAGEHRWITVAIPTVSLQGFSLRNLTLTAKAVLGGHEYWLNNFVNTPAQALLQPTITPMGQINGAQRFAVTIQNNGYAPSTAQSMKVVTWQDADGQVGQALTQTANVPALPVGQSYTLYFTSQPTNGYQIKGYVQVGTGSQTNFSL